MKGKPMVVLAVLLTALNGAAQAQQQDADHEKHHPPGSKPAATAAAPAPKADQQKFEMQMQSMHRMHQKMMEAKTPEERRALAAEHMQAMHGGMHMMKSMAHEQRSGKKPGSCAEMQKRMDMMQMMMEMMMDRMENAPPAR